MALNINTNIAALRSQNQLNKTSQKLQKSLERLSSGLRINWAADDAAGLAIADGLKATATGLGQAIRNANEGISLIKVADGALIEYGNILNTIKEKVTQAANGTQNADTRKSIQRDINKLLAELDNIARTTEFNGQKLLSGSFVNKKFQIGSASYVTATLNIRSAETNAVGATKTAVMDLNTIGQVQLSLTNASTGQEITIDPVNLQYNNKAENGAGALANEINRFSGVTGISAVAVVESTSDQIQAGTIKGLKINGVLIGDVTVSGADADGALQAAINAKSLETGVTATVSNDGKLILSTDDGRAIKVEADSGLGEVLGKTAQQMSTLGHIRLIQKGVNDFQISGLGGEGTGASITVKSGTDVVMDGTSTLASGSSIAAGSFIAKGSIIGGDATLMSTVADSDNAILAKANSTINWGSTLAKGTVLTGDITVAGDTNSSSLDKVALDQDMTVAAGSVLKSGTVIGKGTAVYGTLAQALGVADGTVLGGAATLSSDVTLDTDIVLKYDSTANTQIAAGSTIASGSVLGANFTVDYTWDSAGASSTNAGSVNSTSLVVTSDATLSYADTATAGTENIVFSSGSFLKSGTKISLSSPDSGDSVTITLGGSANVKIHYELADGTTGYLGAGDSITLDANGESFTILDDVHLSGDSLTIGLTADATNGSAQVDVTLKSGSVVSYNDTGTGTSWGGSGSVSLTSNAPTTTTTTLAADTELAQGTTLVNNSTLATSSKFGDDAYVKAVSNTTEESTLTQRTTLEAGSTIGGSSVLNTDDLELNSAITLNKDMTVKAGTTLKSGTMLAAGTVVQEDMTLYTSASGGTSINVAAGTVLDQNLYLQGDYTLTQDMILAKDSQIAANSTLSLAPAGNVEDVQTMKLSDLNVLDYESAQVGLTIVEAAISDVDGIRAELGSVQNQLESTVSNISITQVNVQAAESGIREVDFAAESANFTKMQVLMQAGMFALAQSNTLPQMAIQLLQG